MKKQRAVALSSVTSETRHRRCRRSPPSSLSSIDRRRSRRRKAILSSPHFRAQLCDYGASSLNSCRRQISVGLRVCSLIRFWLGRHPPAGNRPSRRSSRRDSQMHRPGPPLLPWSGILSPVGHIALTEVIATGLPPLQFSFGAENSQLFLYLD